MAGQRLRDFIGKCLFNGISTATSMKFFLFIVGLKYFEFKGHLILSKTDIKIYNSIGKL